MFHTALTLTFTRNHSHSHLSHTALSFLRSYSDAPALSLFHTLTTLTHPHSRVSHTKTHSNFVSFTLSHIVSSDSHTLFLSCFTPSQSHPRTLHSHVLITLITLITLIILTTLITLITLLNLINLIT
jgi:hypothetical protein